MSKGEGRKRKEEEKKKKKEDGDSHASDVFPVSSLARLSELDEAIRHCTLCRLASGRINAVPGSGKTDSPNLMIVGEAPGRQEDLKGEPFVGAAGRILTKVLESAGLKRDEVFITNIVKCRPPGNRKPRTDEVSICTENYLSKQIEMIRPKVICALGATSLEYFTGKSNMAETHGKAIKSKDDGIVIFATYHPAAVLRNNSLISVLEDDMKKLRRVLEEIVR